MFLSKYGVARHLYVPIVKRAVVDFSVGADWTPVAGDVKISKDGGASANVTNLPSAIAMGNVAIWDVLLTATEMQAGQVVVTVADSATKAVEDQAIIIETYGHASAQHVLDLSVNQTGDAFARLGVAGAGLTAVGDTRLANLDAAVSSRSTYAGGDTSGTTTLLSRLSAARAGYLDNLSAGAVALAADLATVASYVDTEISTLLSRLSAARAGYLDNLSAGAVALEASLQALITTVGVAGAGLTAAATAVWAVATRVLTAGTNIVLAWPAAWDAEVQSEVEDGINALLPAAKLTAHAAAVLALVVGTGSTTTTVKFSTVDGGAPSAVDDFYKGRVIIPTSGALAGQAAAITAYVGATTTATVTAMTGSLVNGVTGVIV